MFRNDYQKDDSREGHREVGDKEMRWTRGISPWANGGWIYVTIKKQRAEKNEEADHENMKEKVYVQTEKLGETRDVDDSVSRPHMNLVVLQTLKLRSVTQRTCAN